MIGLDNFATGHQRNLDEVEASVESAQWKNFSFIKGDICNIEDCKKAVHNVDYVLHQAALGSVPRSIDNPIATNVTNISGFLNMLVAAKDANVCSFTYAASSSTYGDHPALPKVEENIGNPLSPYAVTKYVSELYARVFYTTYGLNTIGLRYFNIFGPKQSPNGAYAAVIPLFIQCILDNKQPTINGDGSHSRDFTYVANAVQANVLALFTGNREGINQVYNVACGEQTSLNQLWNYLLEISEKNIEAIYTTDRNGDIKHSLADIKKIKFYLGYSPLLGVNNGLKKALEWYQKQIK